MDDHSAWLVLGSNIRPEENLVKAVERIAARVSLRSVSSVWQSPPTDGSDQPDYLNAAVEIRTGLPPEGLLSEVIAPIEAELGRKRTADKSAPRTIDIDLALYDDRNGEYSGKRIPHPDILLRAHAAVPLAELSPQKVHPLTGEALQTIAARLRHAQIRRREDVRLPIPSSPVRGVNGEG